MTLKFDHINVTVSDLDESVRWYCQVFGFKLVESGLYPNDHRWAIVAIEDSMMCMTENQKLLPPLETKSPNHQIMHFGIRLFDRQSWLRTIDGKRLRDGYLEQVDYPNSTSWYLRDPSGHKLEVSISAGQHLIFPAADVSK